MIQNLDSIENLLAIIFSPKCAEYRNDYDDKVHNFVNYAKIHSKTPSNSVPHESTHISPPNPVPPKNTQPLNSKEKSKGDKLKKLKKLRAFVSKFNPKKIYESLQDKCKGKFKFFKIPSLFKKPKKQEPTNQRKKDSKIPEKKEQEPTNQEIKVSKIPQKKQEPTKQKKEDSKISEKKKQEPTNQKKKDLTVSQKNKSLISELNNGFKNGKRKPSDICQVANDSINASQVLVDFFERE